HRVLVERTLEIQPLKRQERWSQAIAIGSKKFVEGFGESLGGKRKGELLRRLKLSISGFHQKRVRT
ncbi:hypothetical protein WDW89_18405, partial [Deltaproteobacteria bacterium TL4]